MSLFLLVVIVAIALGLVGAVVKGLVILLAIGVAVFVLDVVVFAAVLRRRRRRPSR